MNDIKSSIVTSLDGQDDNLFPFLPYLLQDLWEIGASPAHLIQLIKKNNLHTRINKALDLGCGKGVVSIQLAHEFGWQIHGIDAMPEFIQEAQVWSEKFKTTSLCTFEVGDIRQRVKELNGYDLAIFGSIGPVLGTIEQTLESVKSCLNRPGYVLLDDGYSNEYPTSSPRNYSTRGQALEQIAAAGYDIIDELIYQTDFTAASNQAIFQAIQNRAQELQAQYPQHKKLFADYVLMQEIENNVLENELVCLTWLLKTTTLH